MHFIPVKMDLKPRIDAITKSWGEGSCQHSFVTMYALQEKYGDSVCMEDSMLYVSRDHLSDGRFRTCLMPMGAGSIRDAVERLLEDTHSRGMKLKLFPVTEKAAEVTAPAPEKPAEAVVIEATAPAAPTPEKNTILEKAAETVAAAPKAEKKPEKKPVPKKKAAPKKSTAAKKSEENVPAAP